MAKKKSGKLMWIIIAVVVVIGAIFGYRFIQARKSAVPDGIAWGNGRVEAKLVDVSAKEPLRVKEILVNEGDLVAPGQVLVRLDTVTLDAELAEANASIAAAEERLTVVKASIAKCKAQIKLAKIEVARAENLVAENAGSQRELDVRRMAVETSTAALAEAEAQLLTAQKEVDVAKENATAVQTRIDDATLHSPVNGRVLYRLAEPGEVLAAGGRAITLVNLEDVYMEIFLPSEEAAAIELGSEARLTADHMPGRAAVGYVTFVSPEAQFTPKQVETKSERAKLMFRVKIQVPPDLVSTNIERIKTGVRGVGYVKVDESVAWPDWLETGLVRPGASSGAPATSAADSTRATAPAN
jgi:HlyD family secretion protein